MGTLEAESTRRARKNELKMLVLETVKFAGLLAVFVVAPNVVGAMAKMGIIRSPRQNDVIKRSCERYVQRGLLTWENKKLRLTAKGEMELRRLRIKHYSASKPRRWDRKWRILIFDIPNYRKGLRDRVRRTLASIGFVRLQDSVWIYPYDCEDLIALLKADFRIGYGMLYLIVDAIEGELRLKKQFHLS